MLIIPCPYCGPRDQAEYRYGGEARVSRPASPQAASDAEWAEYLFYRENLKGRHVERWVHGHGCRQWFLLVRDTATHEICGAFRLEEAADAARACVPEAAP